MCQPGQGRAVAFSTSWLCAGCAFHLGQGKVVTPFSLLVGYMVLAW